MEAVNEAQLPCLWRIDRSRGFPPSIIVFIRITITIDINNITALAPGARRPSPWPWAGPPTRP